MEAKSSIVPKKGRRIWVMFLILIFILLALMELLPNDLSSDRVVADRFCKSQGYQTAYKYGRNINRDVIIKCNTLHYNKTETGIDVWQEQNTYYNPKLLK